MIIALAAHIQGCAVQTGAPAPALKPPPAMANAPRTTPDAGAKPEALLARVVPPRRREPEPKPPATEPEALVGKPVEAVHDLLGAPAVVREEKAATIWTYRAQDCELDLYFYMDMATRNLQSLTYDVRSTRIGANAVPLVCIQSIQTGRTRPGT